uniref:Uncharacterized protein n=1 Tax=viral metagenome TaxID=1070528 RepID=A0A6M3XY98_9ZZZZ
MALTGEKKTEYQREWMRKKRANPELRAEEREQAKMADRARKRRGLELKEREKCEACGFDRTTDIHHEGVERKTYILCPNCHALVTRGICTFDEVLTRLYPVRPGPINITAGFERFNSRPFTPVPKPGKR